jgi:toxin ParE1/3/4
VSGRPEYWRVRLASAAEADFDQILQWTAERFGKDQADVYAETLLAALDALKEGPAVAGAKARDDLSKGVLALHAARSGRKARHIILFRAETSPGKGTIQVLRILHDAMDLPRHIEPGEEES